MSNEVTNYNENLVAWIADGVGNHGAWTQNPHNVQQRLPMTIVDWMERYPDLPLLII